MNAYSARCAAFAAAAILCGCADTMHSRYSEPYVLFETEHNMTMQGIVPVIVVTIDGASVVYGGKEPVKPGVHTVVASISGAADRTVRELRVDAQPCTRYYLGAKRSAPPETDWKVLVASSEPIGECRKSSS